MIDRPARAKLVTAIEDYLDERIGAFVFDERLFEVAPHSPDQTVRFVRNELWFLYDDCTDHLVVASPPQDAWPGSASRPSFFCSRPSRCARRRRGSRDTLWRLAIRTAIQADPGGRESSGADSPVDRYTDVPQNDRRHRSRRRLTASDKVHKSDLPFRFETLV